MGRNWAYFHTRSSGFWDTGQFSKFAIFRHETWQVAKVPKVPHIPFLPQRVDIELVFTLQAGVSEIRADFQTCHSWAWNLAIGQREAVAQILYFYHTWSKLSLFLLYGQRFPRWCDRFSKLPYLSMKLGHWSKCQKWHTYSLLFQGIKIELIFALRTAISEILADFQNCHILAWNLAIRESSKSCTYTVFLP